MTMRTFGSITLLLCAAMTGAVTSAVAQEYRLGVSDRLKIKVQEWPDLSGEYIITPDGVVSLPLIGNVNVVGLRLDDLAQQISDRLQRRSEKAERPFAAVEIIQYRPFSILGDVQRPGEYPFRPGLTVIQAITVAGGYYRPEVGLLRLDRDIALAKGDIRTLVQKQNRLLAREARLTSVIAGREDISLPAELRDQQDNPAIAAIAESEQAALAVEYGTIRSETAALEEVKTLYQQEIRSLRGQIEALSQEDGTIQTQLRDMRSLSARGLALMPTLFNLERAAAQISNEKMNMQTAIVRAEENIALAEQRLRERTFERSRSNTRDLQQTRDEIADVRARIRTAGDLLTEAQISAPAEARERLAEKTQRSGFILIRKDGETTRALIAEETTPLMPNDIVKIPMGGSKLYDLSGSINLTRVESGEQPDK
ncbi:polysaccharide export outer membrane protein/exopolysaccharide production protein ExoF [Bradyrhizobium huanghuaihaiense]|uniref:Polysaccharide export outer membrane protein/exopolysaccharide production protein ExoF n=1 Tax=Bradyrhizobium huanghuaihaiense TaxID=990078 RepID=A0A562R2L0_9BRAD|nr:polysaccharide biosynthesis/export family protein [Bradyrhizobium huanghuaihaiense]TWI63298.1 polysaccharide export outer membrane protein/exopolysaccharide production protein ExoF [Bradyrhizobium huanghuaihaiense]